MTPIRASELYRSPPVTFSFVVEWCLCQGAIFFERLQTEVLALENGRAA